ncbi:hypothetical protein ABIF62_003422 [Bradyrhizobium japonicum]
MDKAIAKAISVIIVVFGAAPEALKLGIPLGHMR